MKTFRTLTALIVLAVIVATVTGGCGVAPEFREFTFVNISDVHVPTYMFTIGQPLDEATLMEMHNQKRLQEFTAECLAMDPKPDFVMNSGDTGDVGWTPLLELYRKLVKPLVDAGMPVYTVVGNHDLDYAGIGRQDLAELFDPLGPAMIGRHGSRYSFDHKGCHFIVMNNRPISGLIRFNPKDIEWLGKDLETVDRDTRVLLFLHANMQVEDTHNIVELLQPFARAVIFQGHRHSAGIDAWGGVPVVLTGSLYGGSPEAGSYRMVTVGIDGITLRTRDFAAPAGTFEPGEFVAYTRPGPEIRVTAPGNEALIEGKVMLSAAVDPVAPGVMEYAIPGIAEWTRMTGGDGMWEAGAPLPPIPGRYLATFRFTGDDGSVMLAHRVFKVPGERVREAWFRNLGSAVLGAPVIWRDLAILPTIEGGVYALRLADGTEAWRRAVDDGQIIGRLAADDRAVYFAAGRTVQACDAETGAPLWETPLDGTVIAGVTLGNGRLFVPAGEHALYCLDARQGSILWEYTVSLPVIMEPETDGASVYFGAMDGRVRALDAETGGEIWNIQWSSPDDNYTTAPFWPPVVAGDRVIICKSPADKEEKNLVAFAAADGKVVWSRRLAAGRLRLALGPDATRLYASYREGRRGGLQCLAVKDGASLWSRATGVGMNAGIATPGVVIARDDDDVCCVNAETGDILWTYRASTGPQGSLYGPGAMAVKGDRVVVGTMGGKVMALSF